MSNLEEIGLLRPLDPKDQPQLAKIIHRLDNLEMAVRAIMKEHSGLKTEFKCFKKHVTKKLIKS